MSLGQKEMISSLSKLLDWLEQENSWGTNRGELRFIVGRIGELYAAIMTNGEMAVETNQAGYDVISENGERISVKATTSQEPAHHFNFNSSTLEKVDRVIIIYVDVEEIEVQIIYDETIDEAEKLMNISSDGKNKIISQSKIFNKNNVNPVREVIIKEVEYEDYKIVKLESGTIKVVKNDSSISPVLPVLRDIAKHIGVDVNNGQGNLKNTRTLGVDIINQLEK